MKKRATDEVTATAKKRIKNSPDAGGVAKALLTAVAIFFMINHSVDGLAKQVPSHHSKNVRHNFEFLLIRTDRGRLSTAGCSNPAKPLNYYHSRNKDMKDFQLEQSSLQFLHAMRSKSQVNE